MKVMMVVLKAILKLLEIFVNGNSGTPSDNNISMNSNPQVQSKQNSSTLDQSQHNLSVRMDNSTRLEQMWEVYNRIIKMKEEQARSDAEEIVKLRFKIEDLQEELAREKRVNDELRTKLKRHDPHPEVDECESESDVNQNGIE